MSCCHNALIVRPKPTLVFMFLPNLHGTHIWTLGSKRQSTPARVYNCISLSAYELQWWNLNIEGERRGCIYTLRYASTESIFLLDFWLVCRPLRNSMLIGSGSPHATLALFSNLTSASSTAFQLLTACSPALETFDSASLFLDRLASSRSIIVLLPIHGVHICIVHIWEELEGINIAQKRTLDKALRTICRN